MIDRSLTNTPDADGREPTPEAVRAAHNPETGRQSALDALAQVGLEDRARAGQLLTDEEVEHLSALVHREWVLREQSLPGGGRADRKSLHAAYADLPEAQKAKDRAFVREVVASLRPEGYWGGKGSPQPYRHPRGNKTVDMVVRRQGPKTGELEVLLIRRGEGTVEGGKWALPGGFVDSDAKPGEPWRPGKETDGEAARRELTEESGLDVDALATDQRGVGRSGIPDIGAFEFIPPPLPAPPPPVVQARGIFAALVNKQVGKKRRLFVRVSFADTGALQSEVRSPFQKTDFSRILVAVFDSNGDGVADTVRLTARKGQKSLTRLFAL